jgi:hypothetical protein
LIRCISKYSLHHRKKYKTQQHQALIKNSSINEH